MSMSICHAQTPRYALQQLNTTARPISPSLLQILGPRPDSLGTLVGSLEKLSFRLIQTSEELGAFTDRTTRVVCMICNLGRSLLISLESTSQSANDHISHMLEGPDTPSVPLLDTLSGA